MPTVAVIGAGIVGITTALELAGRGFDVTLIDRHPPGSQTSSGNAGVISASTVLTVNNPALWGQLPRLLGNRSSYFRYRPAYALSRWRWLLRFFGYARERHVWPRAQAMRALQRVSIARHRELIERADAGALLIDNGWLKVYRSSGSFAASATERELLARLGLPFSVLAPAEIVALEPLLRPGFKRGLLVPACISVRDPQALAEAYHRLYAERGGVTVRAEVTAISGTDGSVTLDLSGANAVRAEHAVIAAGPWSAELCQQLGHRVPLAWERGYHQHVAAPAPGLGRPVFDVERGVVLAPQQDSVRVTSGVEFAHRDAPPNPSLMRRAVAAARETAKLGDELDAGTWLGSRPTLPDSLPMIGQCPQHARIWYNFGHQHMGLGTSTGSAELLADLVSGRQHATIDAAAFAPGRFST